MDIRRGDSTKLNTQLFTDMVLAHLSYSHTENECSPLLCLGSVVGGNPIPQLVRNREHLSGSVGSVRYGFPPDPEKT